MRALSASELLKKNYQTLLWTDKWKQAFDRPETTGVWFVWGNSGNGKSSFVMQLACELSKLGPVLFNSLEEGTRLTLQNNLSRTNLDGNMQNLQFGAYAMDELDAHMSKRRAPRFVIIDSFQYTQMSYDNYIAFKERHRNKLIVFISHAEGKNPSGRPAKTVKYDADLKIWVEGFRAISNGRYNPGGVFTIWTEGAEKYWGTKEKGNNQQAKDHSDE